eukprot:2347172-Pyramimonas_sp.AAC.1
MHSLAARRLASRSTDFRRSSARSPPTRCRPTRRSWQRRLTRPRGRGIALLKPRRLRPLARGSL